MAKAKNKKKETNKDLLVLGAGASIPFGFPSGYQLVWDIVECLEIGTSRYAKTEAQIIKEWKDWTEGRLGSGNIFDHFNWKKPESGTSPNYFIGPSSQIILQLHQFMGPEHGVNIQTNHGQSTINHLLLSFAQKLKYSGCQSIDFFLEKRTDQEKMIGKRIIAALLILKENPKSMHNRELGGDWYGYLFNKLAGGHKAEDFNKNNLQIVTFNYDRSLEYYLLESFIKTFGEGENDSKIIEIAILKIKGLGIHHVHGRLGELLTSKGNKDFKDYSPDLSKIETGAKNIKIVSDTEGVDPPIKKITSTCSRVHFLGFGFDRRNIDKLDFFLRAEGESNPDKNVKESDRRISFFGTSYGITLPEVQSICQYIQKLYGRDAASLFNVDKIHSLPNNQDGSRLNRTVLEYLKNVPHLFY